ncbi:MAG: LysM peptidoglycan-binding domain-containing protein [Ornithinimicrobium sp.]
MSAVALDTVRPWPQDGPRRHLRLVPTSTSPEAAGVRPLRITRRGRLAVTLSVTLAVVAALFAATVMMGPASASSEVVVRPGQTLSEIAATHLPHLPLDRAIVTVQQENQLNTLQLQAGQTLVIP